MDLVAKGHERVLRARLADAQFFFNTDLKNSLDEKKEKLKSVLFQADLGSMYDKTVRIEKLAVFLAANQSLDETQTAQIQRAAGLCKADLVSHAVIEFPKLQGNYGGGCMHSNKMSLQMSELPLRNITGPLLRVRVCLKLLKALF